MSRLVLKLTILVVVVAILGSTMLDLASAYDHQYYMQCCSRCSRMGDPRAKAVCYAACMATAASMRG